MLFIKDIQREPSYIDLTFVLFQGYSDIRESPHLLEN